MANFVELTPKGFIYQKLKNGMTAQDLNEDLAIMQGHEKTLAAQGKPVLYLVDATEVGVKADTTTRKQGVENLNKMNYQKLALFGIAPALRVVANFVLRASKKRQGIQMFDTREQAEAWLSEPQQ